MRLPHLRLCDSLRRRVHLTTVVLFAVSFSFTQCRSTHEKTSGFPRTETFYMGGPQWGEPSSFNPLASNPDWPVKTPCNLLYESLLLYNASTGEMQPSLAKSFRQTPEGIEITMDERARWSDGKPLTADDVVYTFNLGKVHKSIPVASTWAYLSAVDKGPLEKVLARVEQDTGSAKEAEAGDAKTTNVQQDALAAPASAPAARSAALADDYSIHHKVRTGRTSAGVLAARAAASDELAAQDRPATENRVSFVFAKTARNPLFILDALQETRIIPKHVIEPLFQKLNDDQNEFLKLKFDERPVVSGPYNLHSYNSEKIALERRDDYWGNQALHGGKKPTPKYIVHPVYKSNDHYSVALQQGRLDFSSNFVPRIWLKKRKGVRAWFDDVPYFIGNSMPMMLINVSRGPLGDPAYRRAMALSVNYKDIRELAVSGYSAPIRPGMIIPDGPEAEYFFSEDAQTFGATRYAPDRARQELKNAGYTSVFDEDGKLVETRKNGQKVPTVYIKSPTGWTDWELIVRIAVKGMRAAGIDARERFIDGSVFWQATATGDFDLIMNTPKPAPLPSQPWSRFDAALTTKDWKPVGEKMYKNQGRFNDPSKPGYIPRFDELLALIPTLDDEAKLIGAYRELNVLFMKHQPTLPMVYRPSAFYQVSQKVWTGFPFADNPYLPPELPGERLGTSILWHIRNAKAN
jgi:peptide/nickel transport system substrate-binding protein